MRGTRHFEDQRNCADNCVHKVRERERHLYRPENEIWRAGVVSESGERQPIQSGQLHYAERMRLTNDPVSCVVCLSRPRKGNTLCIVLYCSARISITCSCFLLIIINNYEYIYIQNLD